MFDPLYILTMLALPGYNRAAVRAALDRPVFGPRDRLDLYAMLLVAHSGCPSIPAPDLAQLDAASEQAAAWLEQAGGLGLKALTPGAPGFPSRLAAIPDPPVLLFARGDISFLERPGVAVIGTRTPTRYGEVVASRLARHCAELGLVVVSGLAAGCDTAAHRGCLKAGGRTVATLAHGLDRVYPPRNLELAGRIVAEGGCLLSEYPPGVKPLKPHFIERDRLQAGLSEAVIVVETGISGGAMHTARFARKQGRRLAALVPPLELAATPAFAGNLALLNQGALPLAAGPELDSFVARLAAETGSAGPEAALG